MQCSLTELVCREELSRHQRTKLTELIRQEVMGKVVSCGERWVNFGKKSIGRWIAFD